MAADPEFECEYCGEPTDDPRDPCVACERRTGEEEAERQFHEDALDELNGRW